MPFTRREIAPIAMLKSKAIHAAAKIPIIDGNPNLTVNIPEMYPPATKNGCWAICITPVYPDTMFQFVATALYIIHNIIRWVM